jgi:glutathione S-transferase
MQLYYSHNSGPRLAVAAAKHMQAPVDFIYAEPLSPGNIDKFRALNPNVRVPILIENGTPLWEVDAITCRLAQITQSDFWPGSQHLPNLIRWLSWNAWHFGPAASALYFEHIVKPTFNGAPAPQAELDQHMKNFRHYAAILNGELAGKTWLIDNRLSYADFRTAFVFPFAARCGLPLQDYPELQRLSDQLNELPHWKAPFAGI